MLTYPLVFGFWEIVILAFVILLVFGGKKIPELMKGIGKGVRSFKEGVDGVESSIKSPDEQAAPKKEIKESPKTDSAGEAEQK
ncbi:MAG: twin-arginine translocase TatA/TatE family subunit [Bacteroidales bacterium]